MAGFILRGLIAALGLWAATEMLDGFTIDTPTTLIIAGLLLGVVNAIVRPFALLLSLPALLLTLGPVPAGGQRRDARPGGADAAGLPASPASGPRSAARSS